MATSKRFDQYEVRIEGGNEGRTGLIMCYSGSTFVGRIDFYCDGETLPQDHLWHPNTTGDSVVLNMPMSRFNSVLRLLQSEKPLVISVDASRAVGASTSGQGYIGTSGREPVGEAE